MPHLKTLVCALECALDEARYQAGERVPMKYLSGFKGAERASRVAEIERMRELAKAGAPNSVLDKVIKTDDAETKESRWTRAYRDEYGEGGSVADVAKATGVSARTLEQVYARGVQAARTSGRRPGVTPQQWGMARVYSFIMKSKHGLAPLNHDTDLV